MDENNQYGNAMTKPLLMSRIKRAKIITMMREINLILQGISDMDKIEPTPQWIKKWKLHFMQNIYTS